MKKYIIILFVVPFISYGQTTEDEFNYVTKGYQQQINFGLDPIKKNYRFEKIDLEYTSTQGIVFEFSKFIKGKDTLKCIVMVVKQKDSNDYYACIPHPKTDKELWDKSMAHLNKAFAWNKYSDVASAMLRLMNYFAY